MCRKDNSVTPVVIWLVIITLLITLIILISLIIIVVYKASHSTKKGEPLVSQLSVRTYVEDPVDDIITSLISPTYVPN